MLAAPLTVTGQDPQFSQFYAAPLYLNPAFAGSTQQGRVGINYRNQWPAIDANFTTISAFADFYIEDKNSGIGALLTRDYVGIVGLQSISLAFQYAYQLKLTQGLSFRPGVQVGIYNRSINFGRLTFGDQFDPRTGDIVQGTAEGLNTGQSKFFPDLSFGGLFFSKNAWLGIAAYHLTQPNQSILGAEDKLNMKLSFHAGWKFFFRPGVLGDGVFARPRERSIAPVMQYREQGLFRQADVGLYYTFEPLIIGTWYRGIPFRQVNGFANNESLVLLVGLTMKGEKDILNIGYSYDYTISKLGPGSGGAHEFSLVYSWPTRNPRKPPKDKLVIPCPDF
ncbi:MAG: type IX secretion system membrane protein PorP/SprF [Cyclobacteriaceae bacterium]|nr:type IX secretion system membrane protein PorP/SprF [Cyclobacteriaceae bacterium]